MSETGADRRQEGNGMSDFTGHLACPQCGKGSFHLQAWGSRVRVSCRSCDWTMGEVGGAQFAGAPVWKWSDAGGWTSLPLGQEPGAPAPDDEAWNSPEDAVYDEQPAGAQGPAEEDDTTREPGQPAAQASEAPPAPGSSGAGDESRPAPSPAGAASSRGAQEPPPPSAGHGAGCDRAGPHEPHPDNPDRYAALDPGWPRKWSKQ